jgi:hypothetical protein
VRGSRLYPELQALSSRGVAGGSSGGAHSGQKDTRGSVIGVVGFFEDRSGARQRRRNYTASQRAARVFAPDAYPGTKFALSEISLPYHELSAPVGLNNDDRLALLELHATR